MPITQATWVDATEWPPSRPLSCTRTLLNFEDPNSASRAVTAAFRQAWEAQHPDGTVIYRDLNADPVPHLDTLTASAAFSAPADHTMEQTAAFAERLKLVEELESADAVLIGAPL